MLRITVPGIELWDEAKEEFASSKDQILDLEHSLISLSKWESKWCKPFLTDKEKTKEETIDYIRCMTLTGNVDPNVYDRLSNKNIEEIKNYIALPMTATWFPNDKKSGRNTGEQVTAELIYYWMIALNIPPEYQKWHLNRLMTLIKVCSIKNQPSKKMGKRDIASQNAALNAARRKRFNTKG